MKRVITLAMMIVASMMVFVATAGDVAVTGVTAQQQYPRNGKVDIAVTFSGASNDVAQAECAFAATNTATQTALPVANIVCADGTSGGGDTWIRHFVWNAAVDVGEVKIGDVVLIVSVKELGGVQLWENGPYWAECNVGATKPEEYGYYFWWGDTVGYSADTNNATWTVYYYWKSVQWVSSSGALMSVSPFESSSCLTHGRTIPLLQTMGIVDSAGNLMPTHDAATVRLCTPWRMPTDAEFSALISNCTTIWTMRNGVHGRLMTGKGEYSSNSIFLPAAGYSYGTYLNRPSSNGRYWSSSPSSGDSNCASCLCFDSNNFSLSGNRFYGQSVRPLRGVSKLLKVATHLEIDNRINPEIPVITPNGETVFEDSQSVTITCASDGAVVHYTTNGDDPTVDSPIYQKRFRVESKTTVKAIAIYGNGNASDVAVASFALGQCPDPVIVSAGGETFSHGSMQISVDWDCADGVLRYTTDESDVSETSPVYAGPFTIDETTTIKAKAFGETYFDSKQVELTVTREWELVATPVISAAESFAGSKTVVSIACATEGATIRYTTDESEPNAHSRRYAGPFEVRESTVVKAFATLADYKDSVVAMKTITKVWGIGDSVGLPDHAFTTDGDAGWVNDGGAAMKSGKITHKQMSVMRSTFVGKGRLTFELKTSCEEDDPEYMEYDRAEVWMNDTLKMKQDGVHDWKTFEFDLDGDSTTVEWRYVKDELDDKPYPGEDCIWVRNIVWMPELTCTTEVPVELSWIRGKFGDLGNYYYDYEDKAKETAANGHKVWECYVAGEDPTDKDSHFTATIKMTADGKPILSWKPPLNGETPDGSGIREGVRLYRVYGKRKLDDVAEEWTPVPSGNEGDYRFFKVGVAMP